MCATDGSIVRTTERTCPAVAFRRQSSWGVMGWHAFRACGSDVELTAAGGRDQVGVLRVLPDPGADVRAEGQHGQTAAACVVEAVPGQVRGQVVSLELRLHLGVEQADRLGP